ncbi:hypothetical protein [Plantibacter sp. lyk4-40-MEA-4]|uniref:hypothetical protein n=1 Tax=Plantibacter sp. lyk4-40-MEA-4 TaxID=3040298 RepID=UPI00254B04A7|nr:hypothetical protein [Plantibacter sp. lyk4-40-MEA-4]
MRRPTAIGFAAPVLALMLGLTACSGSAEAPSSGASPSTADSYAEAFDDYTISLAGCLRDQGFDVPDPEPGTAITLDGGEAMNTAYDACADELGPPPVNPDQPSKAEISDELRLRAQCLRDQGFDVPDPDANGVWDLPEDLFDEARACAVQ